MTGLAIASPVLPWPSWLLRPKQVAEASTKSCHFAGEMRLRYQIGAVGVAAKLKFEPKRAMSEDAVRGSPYLFVSWWRRELLWLYGELL